MTPHRRDAWCTALPWFLLLFSFPKRPSALHNVETTDPPKSRANNRSPKWGFFLCLRPPRCVSTGPVVGILPRWFLCNLGTYVISQKKRRSAGAAWRCSRSTTSC